MPAIAGSAIENRTRIANWCLGSKGLDLRGGLRRAASCGLARRRGSAVVLTPRPNVGLGRRTRRASPIEINLTAAKNGRAG
jgi:hypothetical protein